MIFVLRLPVPRLKICWLMESLSVFATIIIRKPSSKSLTLGFRSPEVMERSRKQLVTRLAEIESRHLDDVPIMRSLFLSVMFGVCPCHDVE